MERGKREKGQIWHKQSGGTSVEPTDHTYGISGHVSSDKHLDHPPKSLVKRGEARTLWTASKQAATIARVEVATKDLIPLQGQHPPDLRKRNVHLIPPVMKRSLSRKERAEREQEGCRSYLCVETRREYVNRMILSSLFNIRTSLG